MVSFYISIYNFLQLYAKKNFFVFNVIFCGKIFFFLFLICFFFLVMHFCSYWQSYCYNVIFQFRQPSIIEYLSKYIVVQIFLFFHSFLLLMLFSLSYTHYINVRRLICFCANQMETYLTLQGVISTFFRSSVCMNTYISKTIRARIIKLCIYI